MCLAASEHIFQHESRKLDPYGYGGCSEDQRLIPLFFLADLVNQRIGLPCPANQNELAAVVIGNTRLRFRDESRGVWTSGRTTSEEGLKGQIALFRLFLVSSYHHAAGRESTKSHESVCLNDVFCISICKCLQLKRKRKDRPARWMLCGDKSLMKAHHLQLWYEWHI